MRERLPAAAPGDGVAELIAVERRLAAAIAEETAAAAAALAAARHESALAAERAAVELAAEAGRRRADTAAHRAALLAAEEAGMEERLARWAAASDQAIAAVARRAVAGLIAELVARDGGEPASPACAATARSLPREVAP